MIPPWVVAWGLKILPYALGAIAIVGWFAVHDHRVRAKEAAKWETKLTECKKETKTATDANASLRKEYDAFITKHNTEIGKLEDAGKAAQARAKEALARLDKEEQKGQTLIEVMLEQSKAGPQLTKEAACAKADSTLRKLAADLVRDDAANK